MSKKLSGQVDDGKRVLIRPPAMLLLVMAVMAGTMIDRQLGPPVVAWQLLIAVGGIIWGILYRLQREQFSTAAILITWLAAGGLWHHVYWNYFPSRDLYRFASEESSPAQVEAIAITEPVAVAIRRGASFGDDERYQFSVQAKRLNIEGSWVPVSGVARVYVTGDRPVIAGGDLIRITGQMAASESSRNPGEFDFAEHGRARRERVWISTGSAESIFLLKQTESGLNRFRSALREELSALINRRVDADQVSLAEAVLLGNRTVVSPDRRDRFLVTGTIHLLAISGLHVGIMAGGLFLMMRFVFVPRSATLLVVAGVVVVYAWITGFQTPVARAAILVVLICLSELRTVSGRSMGLLATAAMLILAFRPTSLSSSGSQLSFLAVATLIWTSPRQLSGDPVEPLAKLIRESRPWPERQLRIVVEWLWNLTMISMYVWIVSMPLIAAQFHLLSPIALILNPLIIPAMTFALYGGLLVILFGGWMGPIAMFGGWLCGASLWFIDSAVEQGSHQPFANRWVVGPSAVSVCGYYIVLATLAWMQRGRFRVAIPLLWTVIWVVLGWWLPGVIHERSTRPPAGSHDVTFIDVGHGNANLLRTPDGKCLLFDGGSYGSPGRASRAISSVLWHEGISRIDLVVISHADSDHYNGLDDIVERFNVGAIGFSRRMLDDQSPGVAGLREIWRKRGVTEFTVRKGETLDFSPHVTIDVLGPGSDTDYGSDNANSVVLAIRGQDGKGAVLLTGDIEPPGLDAIPDVSDVLVAAAPHHGSWSSDPGAFCLRFQPKVVVISAENSRLSPRSLEAYWAGSRKLLKTGDGGATRIRISPSGLLYKDWIETSQRSEKNWNSNKTWAEVGE